MLYNNHLGAEFPFTPLPVPTPAHREVPSWARQPQIPPYYPPPPYSTPGIPESPNIHGTPAPQSRTLSNHTNHTFASYDTAPVRPRSPSIRGTPVPQSRSESLGSDHSVSPPPPVSESPEVPQATLNGLPVAPVAQVSEDPPLTGFLVSPPSTLYTTPMAIPPQSGGQTHTNSLYYPSAQYNIHGASWYPPMWPRTIPPINPSILATRERTLPVPPGIPIPSKHQHRTQQPGANVITRDQGDRDTAQINPINPFSEGPYYGPVLEPFPTMTVRVAIELNPLLATPSDMHDDYLQWNMLFHWHTSNYDRTTKWNAPATHPRISHIQIISRAFPWMIHVNALRSQQGVTCGEVLEAISTYMHSHVRKEEYEHLPAVKQRQVWKSYQFNRSTDSNMPGGRLGWGLKRLDWLDKASRFGGLVANEAFVKERFGDVLPCTFELKCLSGQPSTTTEEVREQERRPENLSGRRSHSWPAAALHLGFSVNTDKGKLEQSTEQEFNFGRTTELGDTSAESSYHGYLRTHTMVPSVTDNGVTPGHCASDVSGQLMDSDMPVVTTDSLIRFDHTGTGEFSGFLNHSPHQVVYKNKPYPTALHLLEALKFTLQPALQERVRTCKDIDDMYVLSAGFQGHIRPDWSQAFSKVVEDVLYLKFKQHPTLQALLLWTGLADIVYSDEDSYWGDGPLGQGSNELGKALVRLRGRLRQEGDN